MIPGEWLLSDQPIEINAGRRKVRMPVRNTGDRPIQVGSHYHFFEANRVLDFDRSAAVGMRLDTPSGQSIRFEAGDERDVDLVEFGGMGLVIGFSNLLDGATSAPSTVRQALERAARLGFSGAGDGGSRHPASGSAGAPPGHPSNQLSGARRRSRS